MKAIWQLLIGLCLCGVALSLHSINDYRQHGPEFRFKGKSYVVCGLQGAGYTHEHKSPVYTLVVISKEDSKKWTKK